jgi:SAM-dependent methyltransferase
MVKQKIKGLVDPYPLLKSSVLVIDDLLCGINLALGRIESDSGAIHATFSPTNSSDSVRYIETVFADYKQYGKIDRFHGTAAEVGPGDNAGVALLMRLDGCEHVDLIDRFLTRSDAEQQSKIYQSLADCHEITPFRTTENWGNRTFSEIDWQVGEASEVYFQKRAQNSGAVYDFIVSRAVLEHLYDPLAALKEMVACLKPGGKILHKIDFRDHGMFSDNHPELTFLEIPSSLYRLMVRNAGRPNRVLIHCYRELLDQLKQRGSIDNYSLLVASLAGVGDINPHQLFADIDPEKQRQSLAFVEAHRHKFAKEFERVSSEDLAVSGCFLVVNKTNSATTTS